MSWWWWSSFVVCECCFFGCVSQSAARNTAQRTAHVLAHTATLTHHGLVVEDDVHALRVERLQHKHQTLPAARRRHVGVAVARLDVLDRRDVARQRLAQQLLVAAQRLGQQAALGVVEADRVTVLVQVLLREGWWLVGWMDVNFGLLSALNATKKHNKLQQHKQTKQNKQLTFGGMFKSW